MSGSFLQARKGVIVMGIALFLMAPVLAGFLLQTPAFAEDMTVIVTSRDLAEFSPRMIQVRSGSWVAWENRDGLMVHSIVMQKASRREGDPAGTLEINADIAPNQSLNHQFRQLGRHPYFCGIHPDMWGMVVVRE